MKSILSLALLVGLGLSATAVEAWDNNNTPPQPSSCGNSTFPASGQTTPAMGTMTHTGARAFSARLNGNACPWIA